MPASWLRALERADNETLFLDVENMGRFRFLMDETNPDNPYPIGFAEDRQPDGNFERTRLRWFSGQGDNERWIGLNCAACHTAELRYGATRFRVDGGPSIIDFQSFDEEIALALRQTLDVDSKFERFAQRVLAARSIDDGPRLRAALGELTEWRETVVAANESGLRYGFSRLDAFGHIFNQVALFTGADSPTVRPSDAPVSYPFLWNTPQHDVVQWNGIARNEPRILGVNIGALGRNTGEVIGVFGELNVSRRSGASLFGRRAYSSVFVANLIEMEEQVARLQSPQWPEEILGPLDSGRVGRGRDLFAQQCRRCHQLVDRQALDTPITAQMSRFLPVPGESNTFPPPGTDPAMACRSYERTTAAEFYAGVTFTDEVGTQQRVGDEERISTLLAAMVRSALLDQAGELLTYLRSPTRGLVVNNPGEYAPGTPPAGASVTRLVTRDQVASAINEGAFQSPQTQGGEFNTLRDWGEFNACMTSNPSRLKAYKARPLNGIWATAPYLHNGSVPNLYQLLLPPSRRVPSFYLGTREFDVEMVGFRLGQTTENTFEYRTTNEDGSIRWGNYNGGHDYGNDLLSREQRYDLIEYMKSL
ncbi:MAG: hypothetical protein H7X93_06630 [Sphingomonadaceae bacterium]|nr:hypothetical protein [Sphingomonadaceae bacterium]